LYGPITPPHYKILSLSSNLVIVWSWVNWNGYIFCVFA